MSVEIQGILDRLSSAAFDLETKIGEASQQTQKLDIVAKKQEQRGIELDNKAKELNEREGKVKHIESIIDFAEKAKDLMVKAKASNANSDEREKTLEAGIKKLAEKEAKHEAEVADFNVSQKKQIAAFKAEREKFDKRVAVFNTALKVTK